MGNNSVPKFIFRLSRFPVYRGSVLGRVYCIILSVLWSRYNDLSFFYILLHNDVLFLPFTYLPHVTEHVMQLGRFSMSVKLPLSRQFTSLVLYSVIKCGIIF